MKVERFGHVLGRLCWMVPLGAAIAYPILHGWITFFGLILTMVVWAIRLVRGPARPTYTYLDAWREDRPLEEWPAPHRWQNPWIGQQGDWMTDRGDGRFDLVCDISFIVNASRAKMERNRRFRNKVARRGSWYEASASAFHPLAWMPRNRITNYGDGNNPIWDPENFRWFYRNEVPQKAGYAIPIQDTSSGDGSGA